MPFNAACRVAQLYAAFFPLAPGKSEDCVKTKDRPLYTTPLHAVALKR